MPLNENAINEILPFAPDAQESSGDVLPLADYKTDTMRARGHQPGIARRDLANRVSRQAAHMAAGIAQFIANRYAVGVKDDGNLDALEAGMLEALWAEITKHDDNPTAHGEAFQALATHIQDKDDPHETLPPGGETGQVLSLLSEGVVGWKDFMKFQIRQIVLTSSGNYSKPSNLIAAEVIITGGGGGGASTNLSLAGQGGGSGATCIKIFAASELDIVETVVVGAGGVSANNSNGTNGGDSQFKDMIAGGGRGGRISQNIVANHGIASGGDIALNGGDGIATSAGSGGAGASSYWGGQSTGSIKGAGATGEATSGNTYGAGGGSSEETTGNPSANGFDGVVVIKEYLAV